MQKKELTKAELEVMKVIWNTEPAFLADIYEQMPTPRPGYTTVATVVRVLCKKEFVIAEAFGKQHRYSSTITKEEYTHGVVDKLKFNFFNNSMMNMLSYFAQQEKITPEERAELIRLINEK